MGDSKELIDYIEKIKKVISKVKQIELFFKEINNEEQNGGGETKLKIEKYKKEILKLREKKNKYLLELELYKEKIKELSFQNQFFNQKISQLSFANYVNSTEKNNLIDKLDFFNKSLDILQGSILTNVHAGNELLEKFNTKTNINQENKVSNVSITVKAEDLYKKDGLALELNGGENNQLVPINNNQQVGGYDIGKFQRVNKISQISNELKNKITLMSTITLGVRKIIENIVRIVNDQGNQNSLLNIRIKFEWIINKFKELSEENEEAKKLIGVLYEVRDGINNNITDISMFENLLSKIETDTKGFVTGIESISKGMPDQDVIENVLESRKIDNAVQQGGYDYIEQSEKEINNILELISLVQRGGVEKDREYYDYTTIDKWLSFFSNCRNWVDASKYKFNTIRTNYYMLKKVMEEIENTYKFGDAKTNPLSILNPIIFRNNFSYKYINDEIISNVFNGDFDLNNTSEGIKQVTDEIKQESPLDLDRFMLAFLLENNSDNVDAEILDKYIKYFTNMNNNLTELLYSYNFFKGLSYAFSLTEKDEGLVIDAIEISEAEKIFSSLQKLTYQTELYKDQAEFITLKSQLLQRAFTKLYWEPFEKFLTIYDFLDKDFQADIDVIETNIKNFILGMRYPSNQSQVHSVFFNINLRLNDIPSQKTFNITNYETTFKYINMLKRVLYLQDDQNKEFRSLINAIVSSKSKTLDVIIKKNEIIKLSKLGEDKIPVLIEKQMGGNKYLQIGGSITNNELKEAFNNVCDKIKELNENENISEKISNIDDIKSISTDDISPDILQEKISGFTSEINQKIQIIKKEDNNKDEQNFLKYLEFLLLLFNYVKNESNIQSNDADFQEIIANIKSSLNPITEPVSVTEPDASTTTNAQSTNTASNASSTSVDVVQKLIDNSKISFTNANRSKITDIYSMLDKFIDGLKLDSFNKISENLPKYTNQIETRKTTGAFTGKELSRQTIESNIINAIKNKKNLDKEKEKIKLILENIKKTEGYTIIDTYKELINAKLKEVKSEITQIEDKNTASKTRIDEIVDEIIHLYDEINESIDQSEIDNKKDQKKVLSVEYFGLFKGFNVSSKRNIQLINDKGYLLDFQEFMNGQEKNYQDTQEGIELMQKVIKILHEISSTNEESFKEGKIEAKQKIRELIKTSDTNPDEYLRKYELFKKLNIQIIYTVDKIISESLNAIKVFVKARKEGAVESNRYSYDKTCVTIKLKDGSFVKYGEFENIFWSDRTISDLYCGKDINCDDKVPLTNSVRDVIQKESTSNNFITYGASGSGKTTLLFGRADSSIDGDRKGIITRIIEDVLGGIEIPNSGTELVIECMIGEMYGEKMNLSLLDNRYIECLYVWDIAPQDPVEKLYIHDFSTEKNYENDYNDFTKRLQYLQELKNTQYTSVDRKFNISILDKARIWRSTHQMRNKFENDELKPYLNLDGYTKDPSQLAKYNEIYKLTGSTDEDNRTLYNLLTDEDSYKKFNSGEIFDPKKITEFGKNLSKELEEKIEKIQGERRRKNRVRCTKYNPDSSRSHMFFNVRIIDNVTGKYKYYNFIDKAGSEIPYEIAAGEFVRLAPDLNENGISFFNITYNTASIKGDDKGEDKNISNMYNKLKSEKVTDIQLITPGKFIQKSSVKYDDRLNPTIELIFSENFKLTITTTYTNVISVKEDTITVGSSSKTNILIKDLELSLNIKIYNSGVNQEFNHKLTHGVATPLKIDLSLLIRILRDKKVDESLIRDINNNIKSSMIKKNMPQLLFSGSSNSDTSQFVTLTEKISKNISKLTNNLMNILDLFSKGAIISNNILPSGSENLFNDYYSNTNYLKEEKPLVFTGQDEPSQKSSLFLDYNITKLITLPEIDDVKVDLVNNTDSNKVQFMVIHKCDSTNITAFNEGLNNNIKYFNLYLSDLSASEEGKKTHSTKINLLLISIKEVYDNLSNKEAVPYNFKIEILEKIKVEEYEKILNSIEKSIELIKKSYIYVNVNNKIVEHCKDADNTLRDAIFNKIKNEIDSQNVDVDVDVNKVKMNIKQIRYNYEGDFVKSLFEQVIEKSYTSAVDKTLPSTEVLGIDYRNLLASYFIQRGYFSKLKQGSIGCNSQVIIDVSAKMTETIRLIFDDVNTNKITKSFIDQSFLVENEEPDDFIKVDLNKKKLFDNDENIKKDIGKWFKQAYTNGTKPETLAELSPFLDELKINYTHLNAIEKLKLKNHNPDIFSFYYKKVDNSGVDDKDINKSVENLLKQLYLISKLDDIFRFFNFIDYNKNNKANKIIDLRSDISIISSFDNILWRDNDKITYMIEYEQLFNLQILFDLDENSLKYKELNDAKDRWTVNFCENYGSIWNDVANKIIPIFLLNVRQGFWINHSIRFLMRNIMYTSDNIWIEYPFFDMIDNVQKNTNIDYLINTKGKGSTVKLLEANIQSLEQYIAGYTREELSNKIFSNEMTLEQVYLAPFDIMKSPWLKLLGSLHQLGSNNHPTDIRIKVPKGSDSGIKKTKWNDTLITQFKQLNYKLFRGKDETEKKENAEKFIKEINTDNEFPENFSFTDKNFSGSIQTKFGSYLDPSSKVEQLRLPWVSPVLNDNDVGFIQTKINENTDFVNLFKYIVDGHEITLDEINKFNKIYEAHNKLLGTEVSKKTPELVEEAINSYKEKVNKFENAIKISKIDEITKIFDFSAIQNLTGGFRNIINQLGGEVISQEKLEELVTNCDNPIIVGNNAKPNDTTSPFSLLLDFIKPYLNRTEIDNINILFNRNSPLIKFTGKDPGLVKKNITNGWNNLNTIINNFGISVQSYYDDVKTVVEKILATNQSLDVSIEKVINKILVTDSDSELTNEINDFNNYININSSFTLVTNFFKKIYTFLAEYAEKIKPQQIILDKVSGNINEITTLINTNNINTKLCKLFFDYFTTKINELKVDIDNFVGKKNIDEQTNNEYEKIIKNIDIQIKNMNFINENYVLKTAEQIKDNKNKVIVNIIECNNFKIDLNTKYINKFIESINEKKHENETPIETFNNINLHWETIKKIFDEIKEIKVNQDKEILKFDGSDKEKIQSEIKTKFDEATKIFNPIEQDYAKYSKLAEKIISDNKATIDKYQGYFYQEIKVKSELNVTYYDSLNYDNLYNPTVDKISFKEDKYKVEFKVKPTEIQASTITPINIVDKNNVDNFKTVLTSIIRLIRIYVSDNGIYPNKVNDIELFNKLVDNIIKEINDQDLIFNKITKEVDKQIISKKELDKSKYTIYNDVITHKALLDYNKDKNKYPLSDDLKKSLDIRPEWKKDLTDEGWKGLSIDEKIKDKIKEFYNKYVWPSGLKNQAWVKAKQIIDFPSEDTTPIDELVNKLSNIFYIEDFDLTRKVPYYTINQGVKNPESIKINELIVQILESTHISKEKIIIDPLAGKSLDGATIEQLRISKQVQSITETNPNFKISSSRTLLLALSTRPDKVELVANTLEFARLLSQITNPPCKDDEELAKEQVGGNINKRYNIISNHLNKDSDENLMDISTNKKYKLLKTMTGGSKTLKKIIYLDEEKEINKESNKNYKIVKTNK